MLKSSKSLISGLRYSAIAAKSAGIAFFNKDAGKKYLLESLGSIPGLSAKAAQLLSMKLEPEKTPVVEPMPLPLVKQLIEDRSPQLGQVIHTIDEQAWVASLGQVHRAELQDGRVVAIKIQYPGVREQLDEQFKILMSAASFGPPKKYQMEVEELTSYFKGSLLEELNYLHEAQRQMEFKKLVPKGLPIVVPEVFTDLSSDLILVQTYENAMKLDSIRTFWPKEAQGDCARLFIEYLFKSSFETGLLHSDPHPDNYGFRPTAPGTNYSHELVLYDFGSTLHIEPRHRATFYQLIHKHLNKENYHPLDYLCYIGFNQEKLTFIADKLPALMDTLLIPLQNEGAFNLQSWQLKERVDTILGNDKWWFRTAGPPWFLMFMRAMQGVLYFMQRMDQQVPFKMLWERCEPPHQVSVPHIDAPLSGSTDSLAQSLHVEVREEGRPIVQLRMPARSVDDLENLVPVETRRRIEEQNLNLIKLKKGVQKSGYKPQMIFHSQCDNRDYKVWLE
ncbi:AarF/UbiB family protein [Pseudobacteriovorax antillogorgiicola]|uniref:Predicted unusual protein kinase regulating ubiquinone biosynthesis, AarF/ABC1/UbiB family n=1 Tax=Pseudobacteriovorax antillogorgiicola TaxID=1513793 RepID=A0A1Y6BNA4_9BACT|nr:AarF/UbiB family protein [Pseudobacteriovorax antillogorgiicola]TCS55421.1 putative unusual protein kinase regulating ubiquinone biosynthesis (AarF/ABC1/UbiB family) [Pseudobacteriovorax antillogorgiicola]SMF12593.1 Predicted unusual protein kinase regulating ubiquinone biosynthesis, AarF/ABC1/UbiB family [Pseudobacteriovorax antillogorgiicola]